MSKHRKTTRGGKPPAHPATKPGIPPITFVLLAVVVLAALGYWWWGSQGSSAPPAAAPAAAANADFQKLKGRWLRPDGGYVIEIRSVDAGGKMDAGYFNPGPIHVSRAEASMEGGALKVFIELRDKNYPGSTYTLFFDPKSDQLNGTYYQALQQQSYEISFVRME